MSSPLPHKASECLFTLLRSALRCLRSDHLAVQFSEGGPSVVIEAVGAEFDGTLNVTPDGDCLSNVDKATSGDDS